MKNVFDPLQIGSMTMKNRFLRSATWEALSDADGHMSGRQFKIYEKLAENETGLICTGYARILKEEQPNAAMMGIYDDSFIPEYQKLADAVHAHDSRIMMQLAYGGTKTTYKTEGRTIFSPGTVPEPSTKTAGTPMTKEDIAYVTAAYRDAARRVRDSGFDAVELHAGHTYLLNQFLSPYFNNRTDEYGGSLKNRVRIIEEIYTAVRAVVGPGFPVLIKITCSDFMEGGLVFDDTLKICRMLCDMGFDAIEVSGNIHGKAENLAGSVYDGRTITRGGYFVEFARDIAAAADIPVFLTGGIRDIRQLNDWLNSTSIAGFGLSRALLAEPDLIRRWKAGDIMPSRCLHCSRCRTPQGNYCTVFKR